jgi:hypothetical protein
VLLAFLIGLLLALLIVFLVVFLVNDALAFDSNKFFTYKCTPAVGGAGA